MGRRNYEALMRDNLRDIGYKLDALKAKLIGSSDYRRKVELRGEIEQLELRREEVSNRLRALQQEPEGTWTDLKADFEQEWRALVQDFQDRIGRLV